MHLDVSAYRTALVAMSPALVHFVAPLPTFRTWLSDNALPTELIEFMIATAFSNDVPFVTGSGGMWPPDKVMSLNDQESALIAAALFAVGNTTNGDFIVIDLQPGVDGVGIVSHDLLWEASSPRVREYCVQIDTSITRLLATMTLEWNRWRADDDMRAEDPRDPLDYETALLLGFRSRTDNKKDVK